MLSTSTNSPTDRVDLLKRNRLTNRVSTILIVGSSLFSLLYILAALNYPGGSTTDPSATGFNIVTNYWCDLLGSRAKNGQPNPAKPIAVAAMVALCLTLAYFWYVTPYLFGFSTVKKRCLQLAGVLSMAIAPFIMTPYHDTVINIAGLMGVVALSGTLAGIYRRRWISLLGLGILCLFLSGLNRYIYQDPQLIGYLPVIQKITFFLFLFWFCLIGLRFRRNNRIL